MENEREWTWTPGFSRRRIRSERGTYNDVERALSRRSFDCKHAHGYKQKTPTRGRTDHFSNVLADKTVSKFLLALTYLQS